MSIYDVIAQGNRNRLSDDMYAGVKAHNDMREAPLRRNALISDNQIKEQSILENKNKLAESEKINTARNLYPIFSKAMGYKTVPEQRQALLSGAQGMMQYFDDDDKEAIRQMSSMDDNQFSQGLSAASEHFKLLLGKEFYNAGRDDYFVPRDVTLPDGRVVPASFDTRRNKWDVPDLSSVEAPKSSGITSPKYDPEANKRLEAAKTQGQKDVELTMNPQIKSATDKATFEQDRENTMGGITDTITSARDILTTGKPTASGVGSIVDRAAAWIGVSPPGVEAADQLRVYGAALVTKVPRFEGPQGVLDVNLYKEMAGQIGDSDIPVPRRLEALKAIQSMWEKFDKYGPNYSPSQDPEVNRPSLDNLRQRVR